MSLSWPVGPPVSSLMNPQVLALAFVLGVILIDWAIRVFSDRLFPPTGRKFNRNADRTWRLRTSPAPGEHSRARITGMARLIGVSAKQLNGSAI